MQRGSIVKFLLGAASALLVLFLVYQLPPVHQRLSWRVDFALTYLRGVISPAGALPTARPLPTSPATATAPVAPAPTTPPAATPLPSEPPTLVPPTEAPTATATPIPDTVRLDPPKFEQQAINDCGPATLSAYLRFYGWEGDQQTIADLVKPDPEDRNVNVDELQYFVQTKAGWAKFQYRVGMDVERLKRFLAAGIPVMIEEGMRIDQSYWPNDDLWAGHYLLITGYDDPAKSFITQDSFYGPNRAVTYTELERNWETFNHVLLLVYLPDMEDTVKAILGPDWDVDANRQNALDAAQAKTQSDLKDAFAWFNAGTNLTYFERYSDAAKSYDQARSIGLPQRMLRYQFGPFIAYFHTSRSQDLADLVDYALHVTPMSEEALMWHGWVLYRAGDRAGAESEFKKALAINPGYLDAQYGLNFLASN